jgi:hypothetical protein
VDIVSYEEYEVDTKDIKFDFHEDKEDAVPTVKAATINKLIERLTSSKYSGTPSLSLDETRHCKIIHTSVC